MKPRIKQIMAKGEATFEVEHYRKDKTTFPLQVYVKTITWEGKKCFLSVASDITERKRIEENLQSANQMLKAITRYSPLAIITTDLDTNILTWNPAAEQIFGWSEAEVLGRKNPIVPKDKQGEYNGLRGKVQEGVPYLPGSCFVKRRTGR